ncbi:MAG: Holliday junction resolvase RuvX [Bacteroidetes bacterium]|nr:Holliday junction resolvase RuvX [Bacteroidota bacterium]MCH8942756.1 Holliday junction resolvase RuvX [Bacteroidota bacterium]
MTESLNLKRTLAIDYGTKRVGLALTDPLLTFAYPFETLTNDKNLWKQLKHIMDEKGINKIILGYPIREDGKESILIREINKFKEKLEKLFKVDIILWDEIYTSRIAEKRILETRTKKKDRRDKRLIDSNAAAIMLQEYLDSK